MNIQGLNRMRIKWHNSVGVLLLGLLFLIAVYSTLKNKIYPQYQSIHNIKPRTVQDEKAGPNHSKYEMCWKDETDNHDNLEEYLNWRRIQILSCCGDVCNTTINCKTVMLYRNLAQTFWEENQF